MDTFSGRSNRPAQPVQPEPRRVVEPERPMPTVSRNSNQRIAEPKKGKSRKLIIVAAVFVLFALITVAIITLAGKIGSSAIDSSKYQAVFLTNNQVYFGKLQKSTDNYYKLTDVFYLQATQAQADVTDINAENPQDPAGQTGVQLIKLGNEVHGPEDAMIIDRSQVLFIENLKKNGNVVDSIDKYKKENK